METTNGQHSPLLRTEILNGKEAISTIGKDWDDLFSRAADCSPGLSKAWVNTFIATGQLRGKPSVITVWCEEKLVALFPLASRSFLSVQMAELIGTGQPAYLGLLRDPNFPSAAKCVARFLYCQCLFDVLRINDLSSADSATNELFQEMGNLGFWCKMAHRRVCHWIRLGCSYDEYLKNTKSSKRQKKLRYEEKQLLKTGNVILERYVGKDITPEVTARIANIQEESWMKRRGRAVLGQSFYQKLMLEMAKAEIGCVLLLTIDGDDAAFVYALLTHNRLDFKWIAFKLQYASLSVGKVLTKWTIRDACENGVFKFDFGHGDGEYKRFWATDRDDVNRAVVGRGLRGHLIVFCYGLIWWLAKQKWLLETYRGFKRKLKRVRARLSSISVVIFALCLVLSDSPVGCGT